MVSTVPAMPALIGPVPGGPELLILLMLVVMLAVPVALFAAGVGVGWWLRGRSEGQSADPDRVDGATVEAAAVGAEADDTSTAAGGTGDRDHVDPDVERSEG